MKRLSKIIVTLFCAGILFACGDSGNEQTPERKPVAESTNPETPKKADHAFAREQQLIKEAGKIQGILDQDAEEKKKAIKDAN